MNQTSFLRPEDIRLDPPWAGAELTKVVVVGLLSPDTAIDMALLTERTEKRC
jgi:hypothetical protein